MAAGDVSRVRRCRAASRVELTDCRISPSGLPAPTNSRTTRLRGHLICQIRIPGRCVASPGVGNGAGRPAARCFCDAVSSLIRMVLGAARGPSQPGAAASARSSRSCTNSSSPSGASCTTKCPTGTWEPTTSPGEPRTRDPPHDPRRRHVPLPHRRTPGLLGRGLSKGLRELRLLAPPCCCPMPASPAVRSCGEPNRESPLVISDESVSERCVIGMPPLKPEDDLGATQEHGTS
jgi:hypothetical protein